MQALTHQDARVARHNGRQPRAARRRTKHVAVLVNHIHARRIVRALVLRHARLVCVRQSCLREERLHVHGVAGLLRDGGALFFDERTTQRCVIFRKQFARRNLYEVRIAIVAITICERELQGFDDRVHVIGRVVPHAFEVVAFEQVERLDKGRPLRPKTRLVDFITAIRAPGRLADARMPTRKVFSREQSAVRLHKIADAPPRCAAIKKIARRHQTRMSATPLRLSLGADECAHRACEIGLHEDVAGLWHLPVRQEDALRLGPLREDRRACLDVFDAQFVNRKTVGQLNRRLHHFAERHRAETIKRRHTSIKHGGDSRRERAGRRDHARAPACYRRHRRLVAAALRACVVGRGRRVCCSRLLRVLDEKLARRLARRCAHAFDHSDGLILQLDKDRHFAAEREVGKFHDRSGEDRRHACVRRIAAALKDAQARRNRQRMAARHDAAPPAHDRMKSVRRVDGQGSVE